MNDFEFEKWLIESDRGRHTAILRDLRRELREEREQRQEGTRKLTRGERKSL